MADDALQVTFDRLKSTLGPDVLDITPLKDHGVFTLDTGYALTAACESTITFIDGDKGILLHRGYPIEQLAEKATYLEVCYLLLHGDLPNATQLEQFNKTINQYMQLPDAIVKAVDNLPADAHPMAILTGLTGLLSAYHYGPNYKEADNRLKVAMHLIAQMPLLAALTYRHRTGQPFIPPKPELSYTENFLYMVYGENPDPVLAKALDRIFILHADHEQNASTSTVRLAGSTGTSPVAAVAAGIAALWGPAHGGANEACLRMLQSIGDESKIPATIEKAKDKNDPFRLMGFGHRVYKNYDPRAKIMQTTCHEVLAAQNVHDDPVFKVAMELERIAREDDYFVKRKLYPNVDFYSGITLNALKIPTSLFTVIFALARNAGWVAQWHEMLTVGYRIGRPRQRYLGETQRDVPVLADR